MNNNTKAFLALLRAGLWGKDVPLAQYKDLEYKSIIKIAEEQTVSGIVAAGLEHISDTKIPQDDALSFVGVALQLELRNIAMNTFVNDLVESFRRQGINPILLKGQGIAQCYKRPLWRSCGDVDLLLNHDDYIRSKDFIKTLAAHIEEENTYSRHLATTIDSWVVELHGSLRCHLWRKADGVLDRIQNAIFSHSNIRKWQNGNTQIFLPGVNEDVIFIFSHIIEHFFKGGIGLRQICDWCRLLYSYRKEINQVLMESRIREMGMLSEWRSFATLAVDYLGMPKEAMPLYSLSHRWSRKAEKILAHQ